ncbi:MAG TPA: cardiolipin synthase ClsB [Lysobacter sp.]|nr:cardiolipin synthase ClsB [Lysobacter sp.]
MPRAEPVWRDGHRVLLLENGEAFYARAFAAIEQARREVLLETFILFEDAVGLALHERLVAAARRGVRVEVTVDGYGSPRFSDAFLRTLAESGVHFHVYDPRPTLFGIRLHIFRRMHRKLLVVDGARAFVGGINYSIEHLTVSGREALQDYAVELEGPVVADIHDFARTALQSPHAGERWRAPVAAPLLPRAGDARVRFEVRDNGLHRDSIEREYRHAIRGARERIVLANAYFFPGYRFLRELLRAARRGVRVTLILQGLPDEPIAQPAARTLYHTLVEAGVEVYEYGQRPLHAKVAVIDDDWATVGSSNLDPLSLSLNLEANVFIRDRAFARELSARLEALMRGHCTRMERDRLPIPTPLQRLLRPLVYHAIRRFPKWAGWLPAHTPRLVRLGAPR